MRLACRSTGSPSTGMKRRRRSTRLRSSRTTSAPISLHLNSPALATPGGVPTIAVVHSCVATWWSAVKGGPLPADFVWRTRLTHSGILAADARVTPSRAFADAVARTYGLSSPPFVVHNGRAFPGSSAPDATSEATFVFTAGRLWDEGKNVAVLDAAAEHLCLRVVAAGPLAGPNGSSKALRHIRELGNLSGEAMRDWFAKRPIFVSTALYEPFGLAVLEAAQAGCPLVLSDIPTFRELWDGAAEFVDPRDEQALAACITALAADPLRRQRLGESARERSRLFTVDAMTEGMLAIYHSVLAGAPSDRMAVA